MLKFLFTFVNKKREDTRSLFMLPCLCGLVLHFVKNFVGVSCRIKQIFFFLNTKLSVLIEDILWYCIYFDKCVHFFLGNLIWDFLRTFVCGRVSFIYLYLFIFLNERGTVWFLNSCSYYFFLAELGVYYVGFWIIFSILCLSRRSCEPVALKGCDFQYFYLMTARWEWLHLKVRTRNCFLSLSF